MDIGICSGILDDFLDIGCYSGVLDIDSAKINLHLAFYSQS